MKHISKIVLLIIISANGISAQNNNFGVYTSSKNYEVGKLSIECNCKSSQDKIKLHHFFSKNYIDVISEGKKYRFNKDSIFGYRDCKQNDFRFYKEHDKEYKILENKSIVIYAADVAVVSSSGKIMQLIPKYFFSCTPDSAIIPLTILNLKKAFPDNIKFHDMLDVTFGDGTAILNFDNENKMYKINFLLSKSTNK